MDAPTSWGIGGLDDPYVAFWLSLAQLLVVSMEIVEFLRQDVCIRDEVILWTTKSLLHFDIVVAKSVFPSDFITLWEMIYSLKFIESFIEVAFAWASRPEHIPLVTLSVAERVCLKDASHQLCVSFKEFVKHFTIVDMVTATRALCLEGRAQ